MTRRTNLMSKYKLDEIQANAILEMPLRRLASLERQKIEDEYKEVAKEIAQLRTSLNSPKQMRNVAIEELKAIKQKYGDQGGRKLFSSVRAKKLQICIQ